MKWLVAPWAQVGGMYKKGHLVAKLNLQRTLKLNISHCAVIKMCTQRVGGFHNPIVSVIRSWSVLLLWAAFEGISQGFPRVFPSYEILR